jgi:amino acid transporter
VGILPAAKDSAAPVASALTVLFGPTGAVLGSLAAMISGYGWLTGFALMTPRILFSMGDRGELPVSLGRVHPRLRTPHVAIVVNSLAALALALGGTFAGAANLSVVTRLVIYVLVCASLPVLRAKRPSEVPGFRLRAGGLVAGAGIAFCAWLLVTRSYAQIWMFLAIMAGGWALRSVARRAATRAQSAV